MSDVTPESPPRPPNEARPLEPGHQLPGPSETAFDDLVRLAAAICGAPIALINLAGAEGLSCAARIGLDASETPQYAAFSRHAPTGNDVFVVPDASADARFAMNPLVVSDPGIRFYAGAVLISAESEAVGTLSVMDRVPRELRAEQKDALCALSRLVVAQLKLRQRAREVDQTLAEADRALRANDGRVRAVIESMLEGLITFSEDSVIEQVNPAAEQMFGYAAWELVGQHLSILVPRSRAHQAETFLRDATKRALGRLTEWEGRRKNGDLFRFELSLFKFETLKGRHFAGHLRDISERKKLERMKQEFVATVSHEIRTPLTSIRGSLGLLAGGALGDLPEEAKAAVGIAERNTVRLITLVNDILDLERLESGKLELRLETIPLTSVIERSVESVRALAEQQGIDLSVATTNAKVFGDGDRLVQVLVNLLSNAVKFSPRGAAVTVSVVESDRDAEVRVQDLGRGIPSHHLETIFGRFQQVEASDSRQKGGTGLGLAICKAIVEQHGGAIGVESEWGRGSTFWIRIPFDPAQASGGLRSEP